MAGTLPRRTAPCATRGRRRMSDLEVPGILRLGVKLFAAQLLASSSMAQMDAEDASGVESVEAAIDLSDYRPTFEENFDRLDVSAWGPGTRWIAHTPWRGDFGDAAFADPTNDFPFTISSGILRIEARKEAGGQWRSGLLASTDPAGNGFLQQNGYFEMRAKLPPGPGVWPAFWLISNQDPQTSVEIDALEYYGHAPDIYHSTVHVWPKIPELQHKIDHIQHTVPYGSLTDAFHDYGVSVDADWVTFYLDRREMGRVATPPELQQPLFILLNLALGSGWPIDQTPNPSYMYIDYVRAYVRH